MPATVNGNVYILTFQDHFSKMVITIPLETHTAEVVAKALIDNVILIHGIPRTLLSDQGSEFMSKLFKNFCKLLRIRKIRTTAFRPQSNGGIERMHRSLKEYLRHFVDVDQRNWDEWLKMASFAFNTTVHSATKFTPFELMTGRRALMPSSFVNNEPRKPFFSYDDYVATLKHNLQEVFRIARENMINAKIKSKASYDKNSNEVVFKIGDYVQLLNETVRQGRSAKLGPQWLGPYVVVDLSGERNVSIKKGRSTKLVHMDKLKHYFR